MRDAINRSNPQCKIIIICIGSLITPFAFAQEPLSIDETVAYVLSHSSGFSQSRAALASKQEYLLAEQRKSWPTLKGELTVLHGSGKPTSFSAVNGQQDPDAPTIASLKGEYGVGTLTLSTPIFQNGAFFFQKAPAELMAEESYYKAQSDANTQAAELANDVAKAYLNALSTADQLVLLKNAYDKDQQRLDAVQKRVRAGLATHSEELNVKASLAEKLAALNAAQRLHAYQHILLAFALGISADTTVELIPVPAAFPNAPAMDQLLKTTVDTHPALRTQMSNLKISTSVLALERAENLPKVTFDIKHTEAGDFYTTGTHQFTSVGFNLLMTLMDSGQTRAKSRARGYEIEENKEILSQTRTKVMQDIYHAYFAYQNAVDTYDASKATIDKTTAQAQESVAKHNKNLISLDTLLHDETSALESQITHINRRYAAWIAWADFITSLGQTYSSSLNSALP